MTKRRRSRLALSRSSPKILTLERRERGEIDRVREKKDDPLALGATRPHTYIAVGCIGVCDPLCLGQAIGRQPQPRKTGVLRRI